MSSLSLKQKSGFQFIESWLKSGLKLESGFPIIIFLYWGFKPGLRFQKRISSLWYAFQLGFDAIVMVAN